MRRKIVLIYSADCPNVETARKHLHDAIAATGGVPQWQEIHQGDPSAPAQYRLLGSPTILIDGRDVAGPYAGASGDCCRIYASVDGRLAGAPSVEQICAALTSPPGGGPGRWGGALLSLPAVAVGLLPSVTCPACWPAYAAFLGAIGVGFVPTSGLLLPLTIAALGLVLAVFAWRAIRLRRYGAMVLGGAAAVLLIVGRFAGHWPLLQYLGVAGLVAASFWNVGMKPRAAAGTVPTAAIDRLGALNPKIRIYRRP